MKITSFEYNVATSETRTNGGEFIPDNQLIYVIPDQALELMGPVLERYDRDPMWFFDGINFGKPPAPSVIICLDHDYSIAGHIAFSRGKSTDIKFTAYTRWPKPIPKNFMPDVGMIILMQKDDLNEAATKSWLFKQIENHLLQKDPNRRWLLICNALPKTWLEEVLPGDKQRWISNHNS